MGQLPGPAPDFAGLYAAPTIERMLAEPSDHEFEHFVGYVFEQAGYVVEDVAGQHGPGLDLKLYVGSITPGNLRAVVQVKHYRPDALTVRAPDVVKLQGGAARNGGVPGYLVTTSTFVAQALIEAEQTPRVWPIDGVHFLRYINYVRGSRAAEAQDTEPDPRLRSNPLAPIPPEVLFAADDMARRPEDQTTVLTLANHKGGVGKTTSALNLAFGLAASGKQVLIVDMDPQANLTRLLPSQAPGAAPGHIGDYFTHRRTLGSMVRQTQFPRVWLIPSENSLSRSDAGIAAGPGAELRFMRDLHAKDVIPPPTLDSRPFDWIVIDTGPSMGFFTRSALAASHRVIMPIAPSVFADLGVELLLSTVEAIQALTNMPIRVQGGLVTQWKPDKLNEQLLVEARVRLGAAIPLFKARIPLDKPNIEKAHIETGKGKKKNLFDKKSAVAQAYIDAVEEIV